MVIQPAPRGETPEPWDADRRTWEALARPGGKLAVGEVLVADGVPLVRMGERTPAGDTFWVELVGDDDPVVLLMGTAVVGLAAAGACFWPARRAAAVDPVVALRDG